MGCAFSCVCLHIFEDRGTYDPLLWLSLTEKHGPDVFGFAFIFKYFWDIPRMRFIPHSVFRDHSWLCYRDYRGS